MKTHRPWQPQMRNDHLFNPFVPPTEQNVTLDHLAIPEEPEEEEGTDVCSTPESAAEERTEKPAS